MWKAKVNNQLLAVQLPSCGGEVTIPVRVKEWYLWTKMASEAISECIISKHFCGGSVPQFH